MPGPLKTYVPAAFFTNRAKHRYQQRGLSIYKTAENQKKLGKKPITTTYVFVKILRKLVKTHELTTHLQKREKMGFSNYHIKASSDKAITFSSRCFSSTKPSILLRYIWTFTFNKGHIWLIFDKGHIWFTFDIIYTTWPFTFIIHSLYECSIFNFGSL